jgi:pimeloyl-ACP methyl ester carboxylesterase
MDPKLTHAIVNNEECGLHYWYCGTGPLITFVPGGNGHARQYFTLMGLLSRKFTCAAFDRRQMSASQVKVNKVMNIPQQARDVRAVIHAMGYTKSIVFGSSLGGIIGFQLAIDHPEVIVHLICHEAPTIMFPPDATAQLEWGLDNLEIYKTSGVEAAAKAFEKSFVGFGEEGVPLTTGPEPENPENFWEHEYLVALHYSPDLRKVVENGTSVGVMAGERSRDAFYSRTTVEHEKILGCLRMVVPGHHQGFEVESAVFEPALIKMLDTLEERRNVVTA